MKTFWSWQSDTPGKIGRHFVREALEEAINDLRQPPDVEEPTAQARREELHLDHDRKGVPGSPDLARVIFDKIEASAVFIADVTSVGATHDGSKKLINSNVAIEYGHAHGKLGDTKILMVQNLHYGTRDDLPFDLKHKAGPIQFRLAPSASKKDIADEKKRLKDQFVIALRPYLTTSAASHAPFAEAPPAGSPAIFFVPSDILYVVSPGNEDEINYQFNEPNVFYLRLLPGAALPPFKLTAVMDIASQHRPDVLSSSNFAGFLGRNKFGPVACEISGTNPTPRSLTQVFPSGEIWGISTHFFVPYRGEIVIPTVSLENIYRRVLSNYCSIMSAGFGIQPPYTVEFGAVGIQGKYVGYGQNVVDGPIHVPTIKMRLVLNDLKKDTLERAVKEFVDALLDLAGVTR
jgi:hypothetical protein